MQRAISWDRALSIEGEPTVTTWISHGIRCRGVVNIAMPKSSAAAKHLPPRPPRKKGTAVKEDEQLYFVRKPENGATNGFRHHRAKGNRDGEEIFPEAFDPEKAVIDFSDNKRGAINKLLSTNAYYRAHPWPSPFDKTAHYLRLGDARDLSWIANESVHLVITSPPYWTLKNMRTTCDSSAKSKTTTRS